MSQGFKSVNLAIVLLILIGTNSYNQTIKEDHFDLDLGNRGRNIENIIRLNVSGSEYEKILSITGEKVLISTRRIIINGDTLKPDEISTRGQSSLMFRRKSLGFSLKSEASFWQGERTDSMKKFSLLNLAMDRYYCRNRLAFEMMETLGIFELFNTFCELQINESSEGIFLIIERPEDWALRVKKSPLVIRRGYNHRIDKTKADNKTDRTDTKKYLGYYRQIYRSLGEYKGEELYAALSEYIDIDFYMKWLAFNFLVHNGDYSDEVFFYIDPEIKKYRIIPWDYDDIFAVAPHEGSAERNKIIGDKLIFSSEDLLDTKIATDPYLYEVYLKNLKKVLDTLSPDSLKKCAENTYAELYPFFSNKEIIRNSQFDFYKDANLENLKEYLSNIYSILKASRNSCLENLERRNN
jgi:spore coat protein H